MDNISKTCKAKRLISKKTKNSKFVYAYNFDAQNFCIGVIFAKKAVKFFFKIQTFWFFGESDFTPTIKKSSVLMFNRYFIKMVASFHRHSTYKLIYDLFTTESYNDVYLGTTRTRFRYQNLTFFKVNEFKMSDLARE